MNVPLCKETEKKEVDVVPKEAKSFLDGLVLWNDSIEYKRLQKFLKR